MNDRTPDPHGQSQYQVRFDWGVDGARTIGAGADVIVWVDAIVTGDPPGIEVHSAVHGSFRNRAAVAEWALGRQGDKGDRFVVAVVAAGESREGGAIRFALEDLLAAGAIIDALADLGIDYCSPESAAAAAAFTGMRHALGPLVAASATGQALRARGQADATKPATDLDSEHRVEGMGPAHPALTTHGH